jgi:hypothetical protein
MMTGEGTGKAGQPPLAWEYVTNSDITLSTKTINSCLVHKH